MMSIMAYAETQNHGNIEHLEPRRRKKSHPQISMCHRQRPQERAPFHTAAREIIIVKNFSFILRHLNLRAARAEAAALRRG